MEFTTTEGKTDNLFQSLVSDIHLFKQIHESQKREIERCYVELQTKNGDLQATCRKLAVKEHETKILRDLIVKEKIVNTKTMEEIKKLKAQNEQLKQEKDTFSKFVIKLGNQVNFQGDSSTWMNTTDKLFQHIQTKILQWENDRRELQQFRTGIEAVVRATASTSSKTSVNPTGDASKKRSTLPSQPSNHTSSIFGGNSSLKSSSAPTMRAVQKRKHGIDKKFSSSPSHGFRCICGKMFKTTQNLVIHIRTFTEKLRFHCKPCNKAFLQKSVLDKHLKTSKCIMANLQQKNISTGDNNSHVGQHTLTTMPSCQPIVNPLNQEKPFLSNQLDCNADLSGSDIFKLKELLKSGFTFKQEHESAVNSYNIKLCNT